MIEALPSGAVPLFSEHSPQCISYNCSLFGLLFVEWALKRIAAEDVKTAGNDDSFAMAGAD